MTAGLGCLGAGLILWIWSLYRRDASVVDIWWGIGFAAVTLYYYTLGPSNGWQLAHLVMVALWGLRLGLHIAWRGRGHGEDHRYTAMRDRHGQSFWWRSLLTVFGLQAVLVCLVSYPLLVVQTAQQIRTPYLFSLGTGLWIVGFGFEAIADWQLLRFKNQPANKGRTLDRGLWRFSRHPNYFGESLLWWGFGLMALATGSLLSLLSPLFMTFLLLKVSGVTLLEKTIVSRRPSYRDYQQRTNAFLPWPPRRRSEGSQR